MISGANCLINLFRFIKIFRENRLNINSKKKFKKNYFIAMGILYLSDKIIQNMRKHIIVLKYTRVSILLEYSKKCI